MRNEWVLLLLIPLVVYSVATPYFILDRQNINFVFYEDFESGSSNVKIYYATYINYQLTEFDISHNYTVVQAKQNMFGKTQTIAIDTNLVVEYIRIILPQEISGDNILIIGFRMGQPAMPWEVSLYYQGAMVQNLGSIGGYVTEDFGDGLLEVITTFYYVPLDLSQQNGLLIKLHTPAQTFDEIRISVPAYQAPSHFFAAIDYIAIIRKTTTQLSINTKITFNAYNIENMTAYVYIALAPTRMFSVQSNYPDLFKFTENWTKYDMMGNLAELYVYAQLADTDMAIWTFHSNRLVENYIFADRLASAEPPYIILWIDRIPPILYETSIHLPNGTTYAQYEYIIYGGTWVWPASVWEMFQNESQALYYGFRGHLNNTIVVNNTYATLFGANISAPFLMMNKTMLMGRSYVYNTTSGSILYVRDYGVNATIVAMAMAYSSNYVGIIPLIVKAGNHILAWIPYYPWEVNASIVNLYMSSLLLFREAEVDTYNIYDPRWIEDFDNVIFVGRNITDVLVATNGSGRVIVQAESGLYEYNITGTEVIEVNEYVYNIKVYNVTSIGFREKLRGYLPVLQTPIIITADLGGFFSEYTIDTDVKLNMTGVYSGDLTIAITAIIYANTTDGIITRISTRKLTTLSVLVLPYAIQYEAKYIPTSVALLGAMLLVAATRKRYIILAGSITATIMAYVYSLPIVL